MNVVMLNLASFGLLLVGIIFHIVSIALPHFAYVDIAETFQRHHVVERDLGSQTMEIGLFKVCDKDKKGELCVILGTDSGTGVSMKALDWQKACQALAIIGVVFVAGGLGLTGLAIFKESRGDRMRLLPPIIFGLCGAGAAICAIADIVFAAKFKELFTGPGPDEERDHYEETYRLDWGFGLDITACVLFALGGGIQIAVAVIARLGTQGGSGIVESKAMRVWAPSSTY